MTVNVYPPFPQTIDYIFASLPMANKTPLSLPPSIAPLPFLVIFHCALVSPSLLNPMRGVVWMKVITAAHPCQGAAIAIPIFPSVPPSYDNNPIIRHREPPLPTPFQMLYRLLERAVGGGGVPYDE